MAITGSKNSHQEDNSSWLWEVWVWGLLTLCFHVIAIAFNSASANSKLYVVDDTNRVQILNSDFTFWHSFGDKGTGQKGSLRPRMQYLVTALARSMLLTCNYVVFIFSQQEETLLRPLIPWASDHKASLLMPMS